MKDSPSKSRNTQGLNDRGIAPLIVVLIVAGILALGGGGYYAVKKLGIPAVDKTAGWKTYEDTQRGYAISYPADAKIDTSTLSCVRIDTKEFGSVVIETGEGCGVGGTRGLGVNNIRTTETLTIGGKQYLADGWHTSDNSSSFLSFGFSDKISITYGVDHFDKNSKTWKFLGPLTNSEHQNALNFAREIVVTLKLTQPEVNQISEISNWKTYTNTKYGFSLKYPNDLKIEVEEEGSKVGPGLSVKIYDANYKAPVGAVGQDIRIGQRNVIISIDEKSDESLNSRKKSIALGEPEDKTDLWSEKLITVDGKPVKFYKLWSGLVGTNYESYFSNDGYIFNAISFQGDLLEKILSTFKFVDATNETADWNTYRNEKYGFEFKYPSQFYIASERSGDAESGDILFSVGLDDNKFKGTDRPRSFTGVDVYQKPSLESFLGGLVEGLTGEKLNITKQEKVSDNPTLYKIYVGNSGSFRGVAVKGNIYVYIVSGSGTTVDQILSTFKFAPLASSTVDISNWKTYTDPQYGFSIKYPQDWQVLPSASFPAPLSGNNILYVKTVSGSQTLQQYLNAVDSEIAQHGPTISVDWSKNISIDGLPAIERGEFANVPGFSVWETYFQKGNMIYILSISERDKSYTQADVARYEQILATLKFVK